MNAKRPPEAGREESPGGHSERSEIVGHSVRDLEIRERISAIVDELYVADGDVDVPHTLAESLLEDLDRLLDADRQRDR